MRSTQARRPDKPVRHTNGGLETTIRMTQATLAQTVPSAADGPVRSRLHDLGVLAQDAAGVLRLVGGPAVLARRQLGLVDRDVEGPVGHVEGDLVAVADEGDRTGVDGLGGDVADAEARRTAGEAA